MNQVLIVVGGEGFNAETTETFVIGVSSKWTIHSHPGFGSEDMNLAIFLEYDKELAVR